jgi:uncharacterized protein YodC (DUF2158 family)
MAKFNAGEVVRLVSGGPPMTVSGYEDGHVVCDWFDERRQRQSGVYRETSLKSVRDDDEEPLTFLEG